jgi:hypothetical protein
VSKRGKPYCTSTADTLHLFLVVGMDTLLTPSKLPACVVCVCVCTCVCVFACICVYACVCAYMCARFCVCVERCYGECACVCVCVCVRVKERGAVTNIWYCVMMKHTAVLHTIKDWNG